MANGPGKEGEPKRSLHRLRPDADAARRRAARGSGSAARREDAGAGNKPAGPVLSATSYAICRLTAFARCGMQEWCQPCKSHQV